MYRNYDVKNIEIGRRSRRRVRLMRWFLKPLIRFFGLFSARFTIGQQIRISGGIRSYAAGLPVDYRVFGRSAGITLGDVDTGEGTAVLYLHGGGFQMPIMPAPHVGFHARLCRGLNAVGFMPDYRLAPLHKYPAALDDCERAYRALLDAGFEGRRIVVAGESAGGNLVLGLMQRIRRNELPMPACAVPISPVTEMAHVHAPPSRADNARRDPMLPIQAFAKMLMHYAEGLDASDPELTPIYADFTGFPPLYFLVGETETLLDDSLIAARCAREDGVDATVDVWPVLPHAFPLLTGLFPEAGRAREDILAFCRTHLPSP